MSVHCLSIHLALQQPRRLICSLLGAFSITALALAAMGIYGVMAYSVRSTKEFGIRLALGSPRPRPARARFRQGIRLGLLGCVTGIAGSIARMQTIQSMLFEVGPADPISLIVSAALAGGVMLLASWLPAHRASIVDPIAALRTA